MEEGCGGVDGCVAVRGGHFLEHEGRVVGAVCVSAGAAAAEAVAVDFVDDVDFAVCVDEACGVDGAACG